MRLDSPDTGPVLVHFASNRLARRAAFGLLLAALVFALGGFQPAHADDEIDIRIAAADDSGYPIVDIVFTADLSGLPITVLSLDEITASVAGSPATVVSLDSATDAAIPLAMVVAFDLSGSMVGEPLTRSRDAAVSLVNGLGSNDEIGILTFADDVQVPLPLTDDKAAALTTFAGFEAVGNTALYDATAGAASLASGSELFRRVVVLLSDGEDFGGRSALSRDQSLQAAEDAGVPFYIVGLGAEIDRTYLQELATRTGGRFYEAPLPADLPGIYSSLEALLRSQFVVSVEATVDDPGSTPAVSLRIDRPEGNGAASTTFRSQRPAVEPTPVPATPTVQEPANEPQASSPTGDPALTPAPVASDNESSGGGTILPILLAGGVLGLLAGGALLFFLWRKKEPAPPPDDSEPTGTNVPLPAPMAMATNGVGTVARRFLRITGPTGTTDAELPNAPVTIGTGEGCTVQMEPLPGVANEHLRIWWRDGKHMLHHVGKGAVTLVNGQQVEWASLRDGDTIGVGPYSIAYHEGAPVDADTAAAT